MTDMFEESLLHQLHGADLGMLHAAALTVCAHALDVDDAHQLLTCLGLEERA